MPDRKKYMYLEQQFEEIWNESVMLRMRRSLNMSVSVNVTV
jgi:hypothetical protein